MDEQVTHVLVLPSGLRLEATSEAQQLDRFREHAAAAVQRGECPVHGTAMKPVLAKAGHVGGLCAPCIRLWHYDESEGRTESLLSVNPIQVDLGVITGGDSVYPDWMA